IIFELLGPADVKYLLSLIELVKAEGLENKVFFNNRGYNIKEQIKFLDSGKIFVLPSISEGMPQVLIEAMARGKIVISSDNPGSKDLIQNGKNGYLFKIGDARDLADKINLVSSKNNTLMKENATNSVKIYSWDKVIESIEKMLNQLMKKQ
ncbi:MAG: glycosyltransferase, partial [Nanoarchaeota archaeon]